MMSPTDHRSRPLVLSSLLAIVAGVVAVGLVATTGNQSRALLVELVGLLLLWGGIDTARRGLDVFGSLAALGGLAAVLFALSLGVANTVTFSARAELLPGMLGLLVLVLGVADVRNGWARPLVTTGAALLLVGVVTSGVVYGASTVPLLVATAATILAWDLGEQAINMAEQVGRASRTWTVEFFHGSVSAAVGGSTIVAALVIRGVDLGDVPFAGLLVLLAATVVLTVALYN